MHTQTDNRIRAAAHAFQKTTASMLVTWFVSGSTDPRQETIRYDPTLPLSSRLLTGYTRTSRSEPLGELLRPENTCHMPRNLGLKERRHLSKSSSEGFRTPSKEPASVTQFHEVERTRRVSQGGVFGGTFASKGVSCLSQTAPLRLCTVGAVSTETLQYVVSLASCRFQVLQSNRKHFRCLLVE